MFVSNAIGCSLSAQTLNIFKGEKIISDVGLMLALIKGSIHPDYRFSDRLSEVALLIEELKE